VRHPFPPPPGADELRNLRVHEAVRDYPELLPMLMAPGGAADALGATPVSEVMSQVPGGEGELLARLSWRSGEGG
jgi:hypothetical protein